MNEISINSIKSFNFEDIQILIVNLNNKFFAVHGNCPYDNSKLCDDLLIGDKVFCLNHGSAFSVETGRVEYGPDLEDLRIYELIQTNGQLYIKLPKNLSNESGKVINYKKVYGKPDFSKVVFLGNDPGVISCIQTLRMAGFLGLIYVVLSMNQNEKPFDLNDSIRNSREKMLRDLDFFDKMKVNLIFEPLKSINPHYNSLEFLNPSGNVRNMRYDKLILANGSKQKLNKLKKNDDNVFQLKNLDEFSKLRQLIQQKNKIIIIGSTFSALNIASFLKNENKSNEIIILDKSNAPLQKSTGDQISEIIQKNLEQEGIKILPNKRLKTIQRNGFLQQLSFKDGSKIEADIIIFQKETIPDLSFVDKFLTIDTNNAVSVDVALRTARNEIFALGSVLSYPLADQGIRIRLPHNINESINQGSNIALNLLNCEVIYNMVPFEGVKIGEKEYKFIGYYKNFDSIYIDGDEKVNDFLAYYMKDGNIIGVCACGKGRELMILYEGLRSNNLPSSEEIINGTWTVEKIREQMNKKWERNKCRKWENIFKNLEKTQFK